MNDVICFFVIAVCIHSTHRIGFVICCIRSSFSRMGSLSYIFKTKKLLKERQKFHTIQYNSFLWYFFCRHIGNERDNWFLKVYCI